MKLLELIKESRFESGQGSASGRSGFATRDAASREKVKSGKTRVKIFPSIAKALAALDYGNIFSTVASNRIYVVTKPSWGEKSHEHGEKVAKGFSSGTPFSEIKGYAVRTMKKHAGETSEKFKNYKEHN